MNEAIKKPKKWFKKKRYWLIAIAIVLLIGSFFYFRKSKQPTYETMLTRRADLVQEVSVTGKVKPAQDVDLQFENAGRVSVINYKVGDKVFAGATIASLENQELQAGVVSARADLEKTIRNFNSLGDSSISSALRVELENAKVNLEQVNKKAEGDLASKYNTASNVINEAMTQIDGSSVVLEYIRKTYFEGKYNWDDYLKNQQVKINDHIEAVRNIFPGIDQPGVVVSVSSYSRVDDALKELLVACQLTKATLNYLQAEMEANTYLITSSTDRSSINTEASGISSDLSAVSNAIQVISDQKITNNKSASEANSKLATAAAAFPTQEDIDQKQAALLSAQSQMRKSLIIAPFSGIIGKIDIERGQTVSSSLVAASVISSARYQIEADITEVDIGKVAVGNSAILTLDAFGSNTSFNARVLSIDTSATVVEGVTTYKTVFEFEGNVDQGVRPNMTANIDIQTAKKDNVISVPQRAVISKNGTKLVRIFRGAKLAPEERTVTLGMSGKDGYVEITSGLSEGEDVITFVNE